MRKVFEISHDFFERYGTGTLIGSLLEGNERVVDLSELHLIFHSTTLAYRANHGGPHLSIVPEYASKCFLDDILLLISRGVKITTEEKPVSTPTLNRG